MKIAIIGIRGIPFVYSGFEAFTEQLASRLVKKHKITVYCRSNYFGKKYQSFKGISLVYLPTIRTKSFETMIHTSISTIHALFCRYDVIYYLGVSGTVFSLVPRIFGVKTVVNIDGLDWKREKWGLWGRSFLHLSELLSSFIPSKTITDSLFVKKYFLKKYHKNIDYIPYGYFKSTANKKKLLNKFKLKKQKYLIWVGRLVPDNHLDEAILAFNKLKTRLKLAVVGDDLYGGSYKNKIIRIIDQQKKTKVVFTGFLDHDDCAYLMKNSFSYIETKRSGGTHPSFIDAMASGCLIVSNNHLANRSIIGSGGFYYDLNNPPENLARLIKKLLITDKHLLEKKRNEVKELANNNYEWKRIQKQYEDMFFNLYRKRQNP